MEAEKIIANTSEFVKEVLKNAEGGHDWWHTYRVWKNTRLILKTETADPFICEIAALVHDIADHKFSNDPKEGPNLVRNFLKGQGVEPNLIDEVIDIMENISFSKSLPQKLEKSLEFKIVQDADRLDAIGAIGIARAFNYGGFKNRKMYEPEIKPLNYSSGEEYVRSDAPTINHFYEKLLLLKDLMNTGTAKLIAEERHRFMNEYLNRFFMEWTGEK